MLDQVNRHEHPALADLGARNNAGVGFLQKRGGVYLEEVGGFLQDKGVHDLSPGTGPASHVQRVDPYKSDRSGPLP